ncbi:MAG: RNA polymerase sigma-70 factor [Hamadaea sp.]|nr:RNA polymerase sigma-70 factor [Hamadaea sp.]
MSSADLYGDLRPLAFAIAYRMLGSASEAEDVVQETFLRLHQATQRQAPIASPRAYVATVATRLSIDQLRSARARRERYVGEWLPEPLLTGPTPADEAEAAESLSLALLVLLESLSPQQRAAFLLREVFDYPYADVAEIIGTDVDTTRHLVSRARAHLRDRRPRYHATRQQRRDLAERFVAAAERGDLPALEALLTQDVALHGDGGGKVPAPARSVHGRHRVAAHLMRALSSAVRHGALRMRVAEVNGRPGAVVVDAQDRLFAVIGLDIAEGRIQTIRSIVNPDKLRHLDDPSDLGVRIMADRRRRDF